MNSNNIEIKKGTAAWRDLFYDNDTEAFWGPDFRTDTLYAKGDLSALLDQERPKILFAGTREIGDEERTLIHRIVHEIAQNPAKPVIVSGLAIGTDTAAHEAALNAGLPTVAVLPNGLDTVYPFANKGLAEAISTTPGCALLTQFPERTIPEAINFLARNKTMAMISDIAVIPFSRLKGSAMMTAKLMSDRCRRVIAIPGKPFETLSEGCNELILSGTAEIFTTRYTIQFLKELYVMRKSSEYFDQ